MKRNLAMLLVLAYSFAGIKTEAQWSLAGNSNATATSVLGTTNSIPLRLITKNTPRIVIDTLGRVGIGITLPTTQLMVRGSGGNPAAIWTNIGKPVFAGFGETNVGNADFILGMASSTLFNAIPRFAGRRSRGTLNIPAAVINGDQLMSFSAFGYDGTTFQNPAEIQFTVDAAPAGTAVPVSISMATGTNGTTRTERMRIGSAGDITVNTNQLTVTKATGNVSVGAGNLLVAKKANIKGIVGVNGDTLLGTALMVNANSANDGIRVADPVGKYILYAAKSGTGQGIYVTKSSASSTNGCIVGQSTGTSPGLEGYSKKGNGIYAQSDSSAAVYGISNTENGVYGQTNSALKFAGYFNGDVFTTGTFMGSDAKLKSNISDFGNALEIISALQPKNYTFKKEGDYAMLQLPQGIHYGLIAQDLEKVLPNLVKESGVTIKDYKNETTEGNENSRTVSFKSVNYTELIPIIIKGVQEMADKNNELTEEMAKMKAEIQGLKDMIKGTQSKAVNISQPVNFAGATLEQNIPNPPVNNSTKISYNIPAGSSKAQLIITDIYGKKIKQLTLNNEGKSVLHIDTTGLAAGTYSYTLLVDGKVIETKKMVIAK